MGLFDILGDAVDFVEDTVSDTVDFSLGWALDQDDIDTIKQLGKAGLDIYAIASLTGTGVDAVKSVLDD